MRLRMAADESSPFSRASDRATGVATQTRAAAHMIEYTEPACEESGERSPSRLLLRSCFFA